MQENLIASKDAFPSEEAFNKELEQMNETCEQIKQHLVDTNRIVKKEPLVFLFVSIQRIPNERVLYDFS